MFDSLYEKSNSISYNGTTTYAQSDDVVAKTAYNGTVSGGVTISSDSDGNHILPNGTTGYLRTSCPTSTSFTHIFGVKKATGANRTIISCLNISGTVQVRLETNNKIQLIKGGVTVIAETATSALPNNVYSEVGVSYDGTTGARSIVIDGVVSASGTNLQTLTASTYDLLSRGGSSEFINGPVYFIRIYNAVLSTTEINTELALGQKNSVRKDLVGEWLPDYYTGTASVPTSILDVKAFTASTPISILVTYKSDGAGVGTGGIVGTPHAIIVDDDGLTGRHTVLGLAYYEDGSQVSKLYLDGVEQAISGELVISGPAGTNYINIGSSDGTTDFFDGQIKNTKIFLGKLTESEMISLSSGLNTTPANAVVYTYPIRLSPYNTTMTDVSGNGYDFTLTT